MFFITRLLLFYYSFLSLLLLYWKAAQTELQSDVQTIKQTKRNLKNYLESFLWLFIWSNFRYHVIIADLKEKLFFKKNTWLYLLRTACMNAVVLTMRSAVEQHRVQVAVARGQINFSSTPGGELLLQPHGRTHVLPGSAVTRRPAWENMGKGRSVGIWSCCHGVWTLFTSPICPVWFVPSLLETCSPNL